VSAFLLAYCFSHSYFAQFDRLRTIADDDSQVSGRPLMWTAAVSLFIDHPFLGVGYGNYRFLYADFTFISNAVVGMLVAHSIYFQLLAETGLAGFLVFFILLGLFVVRAWKSMRGQDPLPRIVAFVVLGVITSTLIHGLVDYLFGPVHCLERYSGSY
jgi:putative inorganic carbon (hco3(-)) transporter